MNNIVMSEVGSTVLMLGTLIDKLISAHTESKKISVQLAELRAKTEIDFRKLALIEKSLDMQHREKMAEIDQQGLLLLDLLEQSKKKIQEISMQQEHFFMHTDKILTAALEPDLPYAQKELLWKIYIQLNTQFTQSFNEGLKNTELKLLQGYPKQCEHNSDHLMQYLTHKELE